MPAVNSRRVRSPLDIPRRSCSSGTGLKAWLSIVLAHPAEVQPPDVLFRWRTRMSQDSDPDKLRLEPWRFKPLLFVPVTRLAPKVCCSGSVAAYHLFCAVIGCSASSSSLPVMQNTFQLIPYIVLWSLSLIPSPALRYVAVGIAAVLALIYAIYLKHPATQLRQLQNSIGNTEDIVRRAKLLCPRDHVSLAALGVRLLEYALPV
jgi:hypothetical protein